MFYFTFSGGWNCTFCDDPGCIEEQAPKEFVMSGGTKRKAPTGLSEKELKVNSKVPFCLCTLSFFNNTYHSKMPSEY